MRERIMHSLLFSLEWRAIAFVITNIFFWLTSGEFWQATMMALGLQFILLVVHSVWFYFREKAHLKKHKS